MDNGNGFDRRTLLRAGAMGVGVAAAGLAIPQSRQRGHWCAGTGRC